MDTLFDFIMKRIPAVFQRTLVLLILGGMIVFGGLTTLSRIADAQGTADKAMAQQALTSTRLAAVEQRLAAIEQKQAVVVQKLDDVKDSADKVDRKIDVLLQRSK